MLVFFSGRRLKGDQWDEFRKAWGAEATRTLRDCPRARSSTTRGTSRTTTEVISFGIFDVDRNRSTSCAVRAEDEAKRQEEIATGTSTTSRSRAIYEVVEELRP